MFSIVEGTKLCQYCAFGSFVCWVVASFYWKKVEKKKDVLIGQMELDNIKTRDSD